MQHVLVSLLSLQTLQATSNFTTLDCRSKQCLYQPMICDDHKECIIDCGYEDGDSYTDNDKACKHSVVICAANTKCEILCDGNEACDTLRIDATKATELIVTCNEYFESCVDAQILCPLHGQCIITVNHDNADMLSGMTIYSMNGLNNVELIPSATLRITITVFCGTQYEYNCNIELSKQSPYQRLCEDGATDTQCEASMTLNVSLPTVHSDFDCNSKRCNDQTLICEDHVDCMVDCSGNEACSNTFIVCPNDAKCHVLCDGNKACVKMRVYAANSTELNITCGDHPESCHYTEFICPDTGKCTIMGYNDEYDVFQGMKIYISTDDPNDVEVRVSSPLQSSITLHCGIGYSFSCYCLYRECIRQHIICNDELNCVIDCSSTVCKYTAIHCPENQKCEVRCSGAGACQFAKFYATNSTELAILCDDSFESCNDVDVYCPVVSNTEKCNITGYNANYDVFKDMIIYAVNGLNDIILNAQTTLQSDITVRCGTQFEYWCTIDLTEPKYCQVDGAICDSHNESTSLVPTLYPTSSSNQPSQSPFQSPLTPSPSFTETIPSTIITGIFTTDISTTNQDERDGEVNEATDPTAYDDSVENAKPKHVQKYWLLLFGAVLCIVLCGVYVLYRRRKMVKILMTTTKSLETHDNDSADVKGPGFDNALMNEEANNDILMTEEANNNVKKDVEELEGGMVIIESDGPVTNDIGQIINDNDDAEYRRATAALSEVQSWLEIDVKLPIYYELFIKNGYDAMNIIKEITEESELTDIGIESKAHRAKILNAINNLKYLNRERLLEGVEENITVVSDDVENTNLQNGEDGNETTNETPQ